MKKLIFIAMAVILLVGLIVATEQEWTGGVPVEADTDTFEWSMGAPYIVTEEEEEAVTTGIFFGMNF